MYTLHYIYTYVDNFCFYFAEDGGQQVNWQGTERRSLWEIGLCGFMSMMTSDGRLRILYLQHGDCDYSDQPLVSHRLQCHPLAQKEETIWHTTDTTQLHQADKSRSTHYTDLYWQLSEV